MFEIGESPGYGTESGCGALPGAAALAADPLGSVESDKMAKTQAEKQKELRREKLAQIRKDVKSGNLVVRQMTKAERKKFPPKDKERAKRS